MSDENQLSTGKASDLRQLLSKENIREQVAKCLPSHLTAERFLRVATTALLRTPKLAECDQSSFMKCLLDLSAWGLEPDGRRAHLIPFKNNRTNTYECTLIVDWKGLAELALRSGVISKIHADVICENDEFAFDLGEVLHHRINFKAPRGEAYAAYAIAETKDGAKFCQVMTQDEILAIRDRSQGWIAFKKGWAKQSPWNPDEPTIEKEMWKKTPFRRLCKWLPLSAEFRNAVQSDDDDTPITQAQVRDVTPAKDTPTFLPREQAAVVDVPEPTPAPTPAPPQEHEQTVSAKDRLHEAMESDAVRRDDVINFLQQNDRWEDGAKWKDLDEVQATFALSNWNEITGGK